MHFVVAVVCENCIVLRHEADVQWKKTRLESPALAGIAALFWLEPGLQRILVVYNSRH